MVLECFTKSRERLDSAFKEVVGARGAVRHLFHRIEVEITDLERTIEAKKRRRRKEERIISPQDGSHPEVIPNGGSGVGFHGLERGREFK